MPEICPRYARDMPEIRPRHARDLCSVSTRTVAEALGEYLGEYLGGPAQMMTAPSSKSSRPWRGRRRARGGAACAEITRSQTRPAVSESDRREKEEGARRRLNLERCGVRMANGGLMIPPTNLYEVTTCSLFNEGLIIQPTNFMTNLRTYSTQ